MFAFLTSLQYGLDSHTMSSLRVLGVVLLIGLLAARELAANAEGDWRRVARFLNVAVVPLLVVFLLTMMTLTLDYLNRPTLH